MAPRLKQEFNNFLFHFQGDKGQAEDPHFGEQGGKVGFLSAITIHSSFYI